MHRSDARRPPIPEFKQVDSTMRVPGADTEAQDLPTPDYEEENFFRRKEESVKFVNKFQNVITNIRTIEDLYTCIPVPEPDPDYQADDDDDVTSNGIAVNDTFPPPPPPLTAEELSSVVSAAYDASVHSNTPVSAEGFDPETHKGNQPPLIQPKPLHNPCLESKERQALHRELVFNYKLGKDVLQKPELNKVLRERKATQKKKEWEEYQHSKGRTSLEMKLEERANRMKQEEDKKMNFITEEEQTPELLRMHRKITLKPSKDGPPQS